MIRTALFAAAVAFATPVAAQPAAASTHAVGQPHRQAASHARRPAGGVARPGSGVRYSGSLGGIGAGAPVNPAVRGGALPWGASCSVPYKFAAGACVLSCPGGYEDAGRLCIHHNEGE